MSWLNGFEHITREQEPMSAHTWVRLGGTAEFFAEPTTIDELTTLVLLCHEHQQPVRLIGGGSNILVPDEGIPGLVISLATPTFGQIEVHGQNVIAGGGAKLAHVISTAIREGLAGLEQLVGIPGTVGGALHTNSGSRAADVGQSLQEVTVLTRTGETITRGPHEVRFSYRNSSLNELAILRATFRLEREDISELNRRMQKLWIIKRANLPSGHKGTCYVFKDPLGMTADELIEKSNLKGAAVGGANIFEHDANFIVVGDNASSSDVKQLIDKVRAQVQDESGFELETSMEIW